MKNNLELFRTESGLTPKQLSLLLNMSVHTYNAIERDRLPLSLEIGEMLAIIYSVSRDKLMSDDLTESGLNGSREFAHLDESQKFDAALYALIGSSDKKCLYRKLEKRKTDLLNRGE